VRSSTLIPADGDLVVCADDAGAMGIAAGGALHRVRRTACW
jgi:hypothetical protein